MASKSKTYEIAFALNGKTNSSFDKTFKKANSTVSSLVKGVAGIASGLAVGGTLTNAIMTFTNFEQSMANVSAVTGETGENLKQLEMLARDMGSKTTKSATEAAEAISYMGLAGWDSSQIMKGIEPVLRLSEAGMLDLGRTSDLVTDSLSALGLGVEQLPQYLDMVAQTSRKSNTNIDMLMEAMIVAGGTFKNLNVPLDEANALLGVLANRGKKSSEAGNSLNSILINLTSGAGQAGDAMEALGLSAFDSNGNFKGVTQTLLELNDKVSGLTEEQRTMYLSMIGGKTQIDTLQALLSGVSEEYSTLQDSILNSNGALMEMANTMNDTTKGAWALFLSAMDEVKIKYTSKLGPTFKEILKFAADKVPKSIDLVAASFKTLGEVFSGGVSNDTWNTLTYSLEAIGLSAGKTRKIIMSLQDGAETLGNAFEWISGKVIQVYGIIRDNWGVIAPIIAGITIAMTANKVATLALAAAQQKGTIINMLCTGWTAASKALTLLQSGTSIMTAAQMGLNAAMAANPIGVVCVAIGALIAIGVALWQNWDTIQAKVGEVWVAIQTAFGGAVDWFKGIWEGVSAGFKSFLNFFIEGINFIVRALNKIQVNIPSWVPGVGGETFGINIPEVPRFAKGTTGYNTPDTFIAGEEGPELVTKSRGFKVFTASQTKRLGNTSSGIGETSSLGGVNVTIAPNITINGANASNVKDLINAAISEMRVSLTKDVVRGVEEAMRNKNRLAY